MKPELPSGAPPRADRARDRDRDRGHGHALAGALVACVRDHPPDTPVPELNWYVARHGAGALADAAHHHGVVGCLWTALRACGLSERDDAAAVREQYHADVGRYLRTMSDLELVDEVLGSAGAEYLVMRGPVLAEHVYRRPDLRTFVDLDLVVEPVDFPLALSSLEESGCQVYEANWRLALDRMLGELVLVTPAGTVLDLHWSPFAERGLRAAFPVDARSLLRRSRTVPLAGRAVRTLDEFDTIVHLALHASLAGGHRLVWLKDLEQILQRGTEDGWLDWDAVVRRAERWNAGPAVALMLTRTRVVLGADVPEEVPRALVSDRGWRAVTRLADRFAPVPRSGGGRSLSRLVARSVRADGRSSLREFGRRGAAWLRDGSARRAVARAAPFADAGGADLDADTRSRYLDAVCRRSG